jgi:hypothetical protein
LVDNCIGCRILIGPCEGSVFVRNCSNCVFTVASQQFRTRDVHKSSIFLYCPTDPVIESSADLSFGVWNVAYPLLATQFATAKLDPEALNHYSSIYDFTPDDKKSNWSEIAIEECEMAQETIPLRDDETDVPIGPPENPVPLKKVEKLVLRFDEINKRKMSGFYGRSGEPISINRSSPSDATGESNELCDSGFGDFEAVQPSSTVQHTEEDKLFFSEPTLEAPILNEYDTSSPYMSKQREINQRIDDKDDKERELKTKRVSDGQAYRDKVQQERKSAAEKRRQSNKRAEELFLQENSYEKLADTKEIWRRVWSHVHDVEQRKKQKTTPLNDDDLDFGTNNKKVTKKVKQIEDEVEVKDTQRQRQVLARLKQ